MLLLGKQVKTLGGVTEVRLGLFKFMLVKSGLDGLFRLYLDVQ